MALPMGDEPGWYVGACSLDGRWVILTFGEGGWRTDECPVLGKDALPVVYLRDMVEGKRYAVGKGHFDFAWNRRGDVVLYRFEPYCNFSRDKRAGLRVPPEVRGFKIVSIKHAADSLLKGRGIPVVDAHVGGFNWLDSDRFVAQLAKEAAAHTDVPLGAIVLLTQTNGRVTSAEQLNPSQFQGSWRLPLPQLAAEVSDRIVNDAKCKLVDEGKILECNDREFLDERTQIQRFEPERYCRDPRGGDFEQFCSIGGRRPPTWRRRLYGSHPHVLKAVTDESGEITSEIYVFDGDTGAYMQ